MNKMTSEHLGSYHTPMVGHYKQTPSKVGGGLLKILIYLAKQHFRIGRK